MALTKVSLTVSNEGLQLLRMGLSGLVLAAQALDAELTAQVTAQLEADDKANARPAPAPQPQHTNGATPP